VQRINGAFRFIDLNFRMAQKHEAIQKPWMYLSLGGFLLTALWLVPLGILILLFGGRPFAWILVGLIILIYELSLVVWGEITALQTAQIFTGLIQEEADHRSAHPKKGLMKTPWLPVMVYALSTPGLLLVIGFQEVFFGEFRPDQAWIKVHPLIPPILAMEGCSLKGALERIKKIVAENLLRFQPGYLPVDFVARAVAWVSTLIGAAAGGFIARAIGDPLFTDTWSAFAAVCVGLVVMGTFSMGGIAFSTFFRTCYHTALYVWALSVEAVQTDPSNGRASPPDILSQAMSKKRKDRKEGSDATET